MIDDSRQSRQLADGPADRLFERLAGTVERVTFHNEENGFSVLKVRVRGRKEPVAVIGHVPAVAAGEKIDAEASAIIAKMRDLIETEVPGTLVQFDPAVKPLET